MKLSKYSQDVINKEFQSLKAFKEILSDQSAITFLDQAHASLIKNSDVSSHRGPFRKSLIHYAAMGNCTELLRFLLLNGASIDDRDGKKRTPLSWAAEYGALEAVRILLTNGAKINATDDMFRTPLTWLVRVGTDQRSATEAYLRTKGAKEKGKKRHWFLGKLACSQAEMVLDFQEYSSASLKQVLHLTSAVYITVL